MYKMDVQLLKYLFLFLFLLEGFENSSEIEEKCGMARMRREKRAEKRAKLLEKIKNCDESCFEVRRQNFLGN